MKKVCIFITKTSPNTNSAKNLYPMKTKRMKMVHSLISNYSLAPQLKMYSAKKPPQKKCAIFITHNM